MWHKRCCRKSDDTSRDLELIKTRSGSRKRSQKVNTELLTWISHHSSSHLHLFLSFTSPFNSLLWLQLYSNSFILLCILFFCFYLDFILFFLFYCYLNSHIVPFPWLTPFCLLPTCSYFHCKLYFPLHCTLLLFLTVTTSPPSNLSKHSSFL